MVKDEGILCVKGMASCTIEIMASKWSARMARGAMIVLKE